MEQMDSQNVIPMHDRKIAEIETWFQKYTRQDPRAPQQIEEMIAKNASALSGSPTALKDLILRLTEEDVARDPDKAAAILRVYRSNELLAKKYDR